MSVVTLAFRSRVARTVVCGAFLAVSVLSGSPAGASPSLTPEAGVAQVEGVVYAMVQLGTRTFIAGAFTAVGGQPRQNAAAIRADGTVDPTWNPAPDGTVRAITTDGTSIFLGGAFLNAGGAARSRLAKVDATNGAVVAGWQADANNEVLGLDVHGTTLYVVGRLTSIEGAGRRRVAEVTTTDPGTVSPTFKLVPNRKVRAVTVSPDGTKVYLGGDFTAINGVARPGAAEVTAGNAQLTSFAPTDGGVVLAVALSADGSRFLYSTTSNRLRAYDPASSNTPAYTIHTSGDTQAIAIGGNEVYFGGHFSDLVTYKVKRLHMASIFLDTGLPTAWDPTVDGGLGPWAVVVTADHVIIGGEITKVGGSIRRGFARFAFA